MGCFFKLVKYFLFTVNIIFTIAGLLFIGIGVYVKVYGGHLTSDEYVTGLLNIFGISLIVIGSIVFIIAFAGCCGAATEQRCLLITFSTIMTAVIVAHIVVIVIIFNNATIWQQEIINFVDTTFESNIEFFHFLEATFKCCGSTGPGAYWNVTLGLPPTCCPDAINNVTIIDNICTVDFAFPVGCTFIIGEIVLNVATNIGSAVIWIVIFQFVQALSAMYLSCSIGKTRKQKRAPASAVQPNIQSFYNPSAIPNASPNIITINNNVLPR